MAQDHLKTLPDPKKTFENSKLSKRSEGRAKRGPELLVSLIGHLEEQTANAQIQTSKLLNQGYMVCGLRSTSLVQASDPLVLWERFAIDSSSGGAHENRPTKENLQKTMIFCIFPVHGKIQEMQNLIYCVLVGQWALFTWCGHLLLSTRGGGIGMI